MTQRIDPEAFKQRLAQISDLFAGMVVHADEQAKQRCPYKDRRNQCTAKFDCRNQRSPSQLGDLQLCGAADDQLDYRSAWETLGPEKAAALRDKLRR